MIAESRTRAYLASIVPVIVNTVLNEHQLVLDIVAFVQKGDFPRSRLGEKQRGKILATWVSRKMRTIAQFSIRDPDAEGSVGTAVPDDMMAQRTSMHSMGRTNTGTFTRGNGGPGSINFNRNPGTAGSSLRNVESISQMPVAEEGSSPPHDPYAPSDEGEGLTLHIAEAYADEPLDAPPPIHENSLYPDDRSDHTPTNEFPRRLQLNTTLDYSPIEGQARFYESPNVSMPQFHPDHHSQQHLHPEQQQSPQPPLQQQHRDDYSPESYDGNTFLQYRPASPIQFDMDEEIPQRGGLRVANRTGSDSD